MKFPVEDEERCDGRWERRQRSRDLCPKVGTGSSQAAMHVTQRCSYNYNRFGHFTVLDKWREHLEWATRQLITRASHTRSGIIGEAERRPGPWSLNSNSIPGNDCRRFKIFALQPLQTSRPRSSAVAASDATHTFPDLHTHSLYITLKECILRDHGSYKYFSSADAQFAPHFEAFESQGHCVAIHASVGFPRATSYFINQGIYTTSEG